MVKCLKWNLQTDLTFTYTEITFPEIRYFTELPSLLSCLLCLLQLEMCTSTTGTESGNKIYF